MSERNGDRARFQKNRKRKMRRRQRVQALVKALRAQPPTPIGQDQARGLTGSGGDGLPLPVHVREGPSAA